MIRVGFISSSPNWDWLRQFPDSVPEWDGVRFDFSGNTEACDVIFVYDGLPTKVITAAAGYRVFVASEPRAIKAYDPRFLSQFDMVLTTDPQTVHPNFRLSQIGLPWLVGGWNSDGSIRQRGMCFDEFENWRPAKTKLASIVSSNKAYAEGHRSRLTFVQRVREYFGNEIDFYGRGVNSFADKLEVLAPYRYHIAIENSTYNHYWTEKLSDPFLAMTYPIYYGAPNIIDYFPTGALTSINILDIEGAIGKIKKIIESDLAERAIPILEEARRLVLYENNLFAILAEVAKDVAKMGVLQRGSHGAFLEAEQVYTSSRGAKLANSAKKQARKIFSFLNRDRF